MADEPHVTAHDLRQALAGSGAGRRRTPLLEATPHERSPAPELSADDHAELVAVRASLAERDRQLAEVQAELRDARVREKRIASSLRQLARANWRQRRHVVARLREQRLVD